MKKYYVRSSYYMSGERCVCDIIEADTGVEAEKKLKPITGTVALWDCCATYKEAWSLCNKIVVRFNKR